MSEFSERVTASLGRLRDQTTQLALASGIALAVVITAAIALPRSDDPVERATDTTTDPLASDDAGDEGPPGVSSAPGAVPGSTPGAGVVNVPQGDDAPGSVIVGGVIKVGITYITDPGAANAAAGFGGVGQLDQKRAWDAVIADMNKHPVNGYKIVPVYNPITTDDITSKGADRLEQEACAKFTQDNRVFMVWDGALGGDVLHACLTKAGIPDLGGGSGLSYTKTYKDFPYLVSPTDAGLDRMAEFQVDKLVEQGFFKGFKNNDLPYSPQKPADGKARIGLIRYDEPSYKAGAAAMKKRLAAHGLSLCSGCEFEVSYSADNIQEQLDDATEVNAAIQNCKSRPDGPCTHMLFLGSTAGVRITLFYIDGAEKQQYRARLGFNPLDGATVVRDFLGSSSYPQFRDSLLVTWDPAEFGTHTAAWKTCKELIQKAGESFSGEEASNKEAQLSVHCDPAVYTQAVLRAAGPRLSLSTWMQGVANMTAAPAASTYKMKTTATRHDGVGAIRVGKWNDTCHCYKPTTGVLPV